MTERANRRVVGRVLVEHGITVVIPENKRISQDILILQEKKAAGRGQAEGAAAGQVVMKSRSSNALVRHAQPLDTSSKVLGNYADPHG